MQLHSQSHYCPSVLVLCVPLGGSQQLSAGTQLVCSDLVPRTNLGHR